MFQIPTRITNDQLKYDPNHSPPLVNQNPFNWKSHVLEKTADEILVHNATQELQLGLRVRAQQDLHLPNLLLERAREDVADPHDGLRDLVEAGNAREPAGLLRATSQDHQKPTKLTENVARGH